MGSSRVVYMHFTSYFEREPDEETSPRMAEVRSGGWRRRVGGWGEGVRDEREQGPPFFMC